MSRRFVRSLPNLGARPGRVLVCEDSDELRALLVSRLGAEPGIEVIGDVADAVAALEAIEQMRPDAVLLDLVIDDADPDEMLQALAALDSRPVVVVFSGLAATALAPESRRVIDVYLDKTTPLRRVAELVVQAVSARRAGERL